VSGLVLGLTGCAMLQDRTGNWVTYTRTVSQMAPAELTLAQDAARKNYQQEKTDRNRLELAWLLSRPDASRQQIKQSLDLLAEINQRSDWAPLRDLVRQQVELRQALLTEHGKALEFKAQLDAMKKIETRMTEELDPSGKKHP